MSDEEEAWTPAPDSRGPAKHDLNDTTFQLGGRQFDAAGLVRGGICLLLAAVCVVIAVIVWPPAGLLAVLLGIVGLLQVFSG